MKTVIALSLIFLIGCEASINKKELDWGINQCSANGGIEQVRVTRHFYPIFKCKNDAVFKMLAKHESKTED